jgi:hypothetical protein
MTNLVAADVRNSARRLISVALASLALNALTTSLICAFGFLLGVFAGYSSNPGQLIYDYSICRVIFDFLIVLLASSLILQVIVLASFVQYYIDKRLQDVAIMKSLSMPSSDIQGFFTNPLLLVVLGGAGIAILSVLIIAGLAGFMASMVGLMPVLLLVLVLAINIISVLAAATRKFGALNAMSVSAVMADDFNQDFLQVRKKSRFTSVIDRLGIKAKLSYRNLMTRRREFARTATIMAVGCFMASVLFTSGFVINETFTHYLTAATGAERSGAVIMIAGPAVSATVQDAYQSFSTPNVSLPSSENLLDATNLFNSSLFHVDLFGSDFCTVDWCAVQEVVLQEIQGIVFTGLENAYPPYNQSNPFGNQTYTVIGGTRMCRTLAFGVDFSSMLQTWPGLAGDIAGQTAPSVVLGDSIASLMVDNLQDEEIGIASGEYKIAASVLDPANHGFTVYMPINDFWVDLNCPSGFVNCGFLVISSAYLSMKSEILQEVTGYVRSIYGPGIAAVDLSSVLASVPQAMNGLLAIHIALGTLIFCLVVLYFLEFGRLAMKSKAREYQVMKWLGAKRTFVRDIVFGESIFGVFFGGIIATSLNLIFDSVILAGTAILPPISIPLLIVVLVILAFSLVTWITTNITTRSLK